MDFSTLHSEYKIDSFTKHDGTILFFNFVRAIIGNAGSVVKVLDFGAGRGAFHLSKKSHYRNQLQDLRTSGATVVACDVDEAVKNHPCSDEQVVLDLGGSLPFEDNTFDLIVSDFVFEHLENPSETGMELLRITRPGGWICARTPNKWGYVALISKIVPNALHEKLLKKVQPTRSSEDVFRTVYRLNSPRSVRRHFPNCDVRWYYHSGDPAYHFSNGIIYRLLLLLHRLLVPKLSTSVCFFIQKPL